jgi:Domain of unknown function (DUF6458)
MAIGTSILLIATGAVLRFAVSVSTQGIDIQTIGVILMVVGAVGVVLSLLWMLAWRPRRVAVARDRVARDPVIESDRRI